MFSHWTTFSLINILTSQQSHGSCWEILWAARAQERGLYCIQVAVKKKKKKMLAASKCPIKCKWHLQGWTGSVHLSVDQSCTRSPSTSRFNVTLLRFVFFFFLPLPTVAKHTEAEWGTARQRPESRRPPRDNRKRREGTVWRKETHKLMAKDQYNLQKPHDSI